VTRNTYIGPEYLGRYNARCVRVVIVDVTRRAAEVRNALPEASIITSYGREL